MKLTIKRNSKKPTGGYMLKTYLIFVVFWCVFAVVVGMAFNVA